MIMVRNLYLITPPAEEPVTIDEAKAQCRVTGNDENDLIERVIATARAWAEDFKAGALITQAWELRLDCFPGTASLVYSGARLILPVPPLQSVVSVKYIDGAGVLQTWATTQYTVHGVYTPTSSPAGPDPRVGWIEPAYGISYPTTHAVSEAVRIQFTAGFGTAAQVPKRYKQAIVLRVGQLYAQREPVITGTVHDTKADEALLWPPSF